MPSRRVTDFLLFATVFTMSFEKIFWNVAGKIALTEVLAILFVGAYFLPASSDASGPSRGRPGSCSSSSPPSCSST